MQAEEHNTKLTTLEHVCRPASAGQQQGPCAHRRGGHCLLPPGGYRRTLYQPAMATRKFLLLFRASSQGDAVTMINMLQTDCVVAWRWSERWSATFPSLPASPGGENSIHSGTLMAPTCSRRLILSASSGVRPQHTSLRKPNTLAAAAAHVATVTVSKAPGTRLVAEAGDLPRGCISRAGRCPTVLLLRPGQTVRSCRRQWKEILKNLVFAHRTRLLYYPPLLLFLNPQSKESWKMLVRM